MTADSNSVGHIRPGESDAFVERLNEVIGDESQSSFARRCDFGEGTLRGYLKGADPSRQRLVAMADAAGVNIAWLAAGRGPKKGAEPAPQRPPVVFDDQARLQATIEAVEEGLAMINRKLSPAVYAEVVALAYVIMSSPNSTKANVHQVVRYAA